MKALETSAAVEDTVAGTLRGLRIGLVLGGGGAKGAYQIGCWKALRKAGVTQFDAIAGTSIGAINGLLVATDKLETAESEWKAFHWRTIVGSSGRRMAFLTLWVFSALSSEALRLFGLLGSESRIHPERMLGWRNSAACFGIALAVLPLRGVVPPAWAGVHGWLLALPIGLGLLVLVHRAVRGVFLGWFFSERNPVAERLRSTISEADHEGIRSAQMPVYATLSRVPPRTPGSAWSPQYVRLDLMSRAGALDVLIQGAGLPAVFPARIAGEAAADGGWTDNIPAAPLLFDPEVELDIVFVIGLKRTTTWQPQRSLLHGARSLLRTSMFGVTEEPADLRTLATRRWEAHDRLRGGGLALPAERRVPRIVSVTPSEPLGTFLSGALWFSADKAERLIDLGERDMNRALEGLA